MQAACGRRVRRAWPRPGPLPRTTRHLQRGETRWSPRPPHPPLYLRCPTLSCLSTNLAMPKEFQSAPRKTLLLLPATMPYRPRPPPLRLPIPTHPCSPRPTPAPRQQRPQQRAQHPRPRSLRLPGPRTAATAPQHTPRTFSYPRWTSALQTTPLPLHRPTQLFSPAAAAVLVARRSS